jgi:glycine hydroxymethyltransferase
MILCKKQYAQAIDKSVFPGLQGGPHMHQVAATALTMKLAATDQFKTYATNTIANAKALAAALMAGGMELVTGGTDNHMMVVDTMSSLKMSGDIAEKTLDAAGITLNKQMIPDDPNPPMKPSGIRLGTPAATARLMGQEEMKKLAAIMVKALHAASDPQLLSGLRAETKAICDRFPVPGVTADGPFAKTRSAAA